MQVLFKSEELKKKKKKKKSKRIEELEEENGRLLPLSFNSR